MADEQTPQTPESPEAYDLENGPLKSSVEALMARLGLSADASGTEDAIGSEGEPDVPQGGTAPSEKADDGTTIDWSQFELEPSLEHLYHKSQPMELPDGTTGFVTPWAEFKTKSVPVSTAGEYITQMVNGSEQWQLSALLPNGSGLMVVVLQRMTRRLLPHPTMLVTETNVEIPKDEELQQTEDAALSWAGQAETPERRAVLDALAAETEKQAVTLETAVEGADVTSID